MYLSRLILNPRSRQARVELTDPYEMHRTICRAFPNANFKVNEPSGILFRVDIHPETRIPVLLVQSLHSPDWSFLLKEGRDYLLPEQYLPFGEQNLVWKTLALELKPEQVLCFRLRANPTVKKDREGKKQGRRMGLIHKKDQLCWLKDKLQSAGAKLISIHVSPYQMTRARLFTEKQDEKRMRFLAVQFDGILQIEDPFALKKALSTGIGSGKGLGFGLLSLAPFVTNTGADLKSFKTQIVEEV